MVIDTDAAAAANEKGAIDVKAAAALELDGTNCIVQDPVVKRNANW